MTWRKPVPITIDGVTYPSKEALRQATRRILSTLAWLPEIQEGHEQFHFLMDLVKRHPRPDEKLSEGIRGFLVGVNPWSPGNTLDIVRPDGTKVDISWRSCITGIDAAPMMNLLSAMRLVVMPQIILLKDTLEYPYYCPKCNNPCSCREDVEVHHIYPFRRLAEDFIAITSLPIPTTFESGRNNVATFKDEDIHFASDWSLYHEWTGILEVLCSLCHIRITAKEATSK